MEWAIIVSIFVLAIQLERAIMKPLLKRLDEIETQLSAIQNDTEEIKRDISNN